MQNGDTYVFKIKSEIKNILKIDKILFEYNKPTQNFYINFIKYFRFSFDGLKFSEWKEFYDLNDLNESYPKEKNIFFDFKIYIKEITDSEVEITNFNFHYLEDTTLLPIQVPFDILYERNGYTEFKPVDDFNVGKWDYLNQWKALNLLKDINFQNQNLFGIPVKYIRANPVITSKDPFLLEYGLYNYEQPKSIKVLVENNEFLKNNISFSSFGLDYAETFKITIDKRYFEDHFGIGMAPQKHDVIYFPISDKIFIVESQNIAERTFMEYSMTYELNLKKYVNQGMINETDTDAQELIDKTTDSFVAIIGQDQAAEEKAVANSKTFSTKNIFRHYRSYIGEENGNSINDCIISEDILYHGSPFSRTHYDFTQKFYEHSEINDKILQYKLKQEGTYSLNNETILFWNKISDDEKISGRKKRKVLKIVNVGENTYRIFTKILPSNLEIGGYLSVYCGENLVQFAKIISINRSFSYIVVDFNLELEKFLDEEGNYIDWKNDIDSLKIGKGVLQEIISCKSGISGYKITILDEHILNIEYGSQNNQMFRLSHKLSSDKWKCFLIKILKDFKQISLYQYLLESESSIKLINQKIIEKDLNDIIFDNIDFYMTLSPTMLTNIHIFSEPVREEDQMKLITEHVSNNMDKAVLIDNADRFLISPFVSTP